MNKYEINPQPPPIPPRRKKRKNNVSTSVNSEATREPSSGPRRKPRLPPPPPPPPPVQKAREKRHLIKNSQHLGKTETDIENNSLTQVNAENVPYEVTFNIRANPENKISSQNYRSKSVEPNRYPPLLFTFQDFQSVMGESNAKTNEKISSSIVDETFPSNNLIDESKVCFRVTTTNVPFEKCLGTWQNSFDNPEFESYEESLFIFEDYLDRSKRTNARPDLFRLESLETSPSDFSPNTPKVRFVIESPSNSTPDENSEITMDSLQNLESLNKDLEELQKIQSICEAIQHSNENPASRAFDSLLCDENDVNLIEIDSESLAQSPIEKETSVISVNKTPNETVTEIPPINEISKIENKDNSTQFSKFQAFGSKKSNSDSYEDACDSENFVSTENDNENTELQKMSPERCEKIPIDSPSCDCDNPTKDDFPRTEETNRQKSVPMSVRRNSFLDKMLNNDQVSCAVIATHRKPDDSQPDAKRETSVLSTERVPVKKCPKIEKQNSVQKSVNEAKCDVLNELLCNFSAIKLKSVAANGKIVDRDTSANRVKFVDKCAREQKTDDDELRVENDCGASAKVTDSSDALASVADDPIASVDKCAIDRRSPKTCNNSTDNNAKTPVALSNDQSHKAFSITPGSVKNFIKHYEIHRETSNQCFKARAKMNDPRIKEADSKTEDDSEKMDSDPKNQEGHPSQMGSDFGKETDSKESVFKTDPSHKNVKTEADDPEEGESGTKNKTVSANEGNNPETTENDLRIENNSGNKENESEEKENPSKTEERTKQETEEKTSIDLVDLKESDSCKSSEVMMHSKQESCLQSSRPRVTIGRRHSCIKSNDSSPVSELKKSVQFDSACTVYQLQKHEENTKSSLINGIRSRIKGKAPNKPEMQMPITFKTTLRSDDSTPEVQNGSELESAGNASKSGTGHLVPKSENPRHNQTFVFYCKV